MLVEVDSLPCDLTLRPGNGGCVLAFSTSVPIDAVRVDAFGNCAVGPAPVNFKTGAMDCGRCVREFQLPAFVTTLRLLGNGLKVYINNFIAPSAGLSIENAGRYNYIAFANNTFEQLRLFDRGRECRFDFQKQQSLPMHTETRADTKLLFSATTNPQCFLCNDQEATQIFADCGHWLMCRTCCERYTGQTNGLQCPVCRKTTTQIITARIYSCM